MLRLSAAALLALFASCVSLVDALPAVGSPLPTLVGAVPTVTDADGMVDRDLLIANIQHTFAKYNFTAIGESAANASVNATASRLRAKRQGGDGASGALLDPNRIKLGIITQDPAVGLVRRAVAARRALPK